MGKIRILIADDDSVVRTALTELIQSRSDMMLVGAALLLLVAITKFVVVVAGRQQ